MKYLLIILLVISFNAFAEDRFDIDTTYQCDKYRTMMTLIAVDFEETLAFEGFDKEVITALFINKITGTWTIIMYDEDKIYACYVDHGVGHTR